MTSSAKKILAEAMSLPEDERCHVAEQLLDSVSHETADEIERAWNDEAVQRATKLERGETVSLDGEASVRALEEKLGSIQRG